VRIVTTDGGRFGVAAIDPGADDRSLVSPPVVSAPVPSAPLSARQREILACLAQGKPVEEIAAATYLSASTVRNHLSRASSGSDDCPVDPPKIGTSA
jgi:DNA-binding NarL/FixJ family response regulator